MKTLQRLLSVAGCLTLTISLTGCGGQIADLPELGTVMGTITLDGKPLANASVSFTPMSGRHSGGTTDDQGYYSLQYTADESGAKVGLHTVRINIAPEEDYLDDSDEGSAAADDDAAAKLPVVYNRKSELSADVKAGANTFHFYLTSDGSGR